MNVTLNSNSSLSSRRGRRPVRPTAAGAAAGLTRRMRRAWREGFAAALGLALTVLLWNSPVPAAHADESGATAATAAKVETPAAAQVDVPLDTPRTLSVEPTPERRPFSYDKAKRPAWVDQGAQHAGETQFTVVTSGPRVTDREAQRGLDEEIVKAVRDYVGEYLDSPTAAEVLPLSLRDIKARMRTDQFYVELVEFDIGPMYIAYALVEFNPEFRADLEQRWQNIVSYGRVATFGVGIGAIFLVLGSLLTYLRVDTATRGYYTRRLQLAAVTTILAVVTAGVVLARHFFLI